MMVSNGLYECVKRDIQDKHKLEINTVQHRLDTICRLWWMVGHLDCDLKKIVCWLFGRHFAFSLTTCSSFFKYWYVIHCYIKIKDVALRQLFKFQETIWHKVNMHLSSQFFRLYSWYYCSSTSKRRNIRRRDTS